MSTTATTVRKAKIASLKGAGYNPKVRINRVNPLIRSIERVGLLYPILVNKSMQVVDGHRRLKACERLGWDEVPIIVVEGEQSELFSEANTSARVFTGNQTLNVYLKEPRAVGGRARANIQACEDVVGRAILRRMASEGFSIRTWDVARRVARLADQNDPAMLNRIVKWMLNFGCAGTVKDALARGTPPGLIIAAVKRNKRIQAKYDVGK